MCQAIPRPVLRVGEGSAEVLIDGRPTWVNTLAVPDLVPGEYIVVYAGAAVERIAEAEAREMLDFLTMMDSLFDGGDPALLREHDR